ILTKQKNLADKNIEIEKQKEEISDKASLLERQKEELAVLNSFKNKLFSIISHDLKSPLYALRNLFQNMQQFNLPADEIKEMIPDVLIDLNYTTSLMENLLQWAKSQMQADVVNAQLVNVAHIITGVVNLLRLQADAKKISFEQVSNEDVFAYTDADMIQLVLRNLLSNALKFTPPGGHIKIGCHDFKEFTEVFVQDSGLGIGKEGLENIRRKTFYTTTGTSSETGTGLGLLLCSEFLAKNGSQLIIESEPHKGSIFSFRLPKRAAHDAKVVEDRHEK
ncbi:MAG: HAMP domain-containing histidine kinase, partial [Bacteroidota bacterium]|nr:HAMP domain-containing histidine kinase [Bacteroidota bacterium]